MALSRTKTMLDSEAPVIVSVERFTAEERFFPIGPSRRAVVLGRSPDSSFSFRFETCNLKSVDLEPFETLRNHGFTTVNAQSDWRSLHPPEIWQGRIVKQAIDQVNALPKSALDDEQSGLDAGLAGQILQSLDVAFPDSLQLFEIKRWLRPEPSDVALDKALRALHIKAYIDRQAKTRLIRLDPMERITLTKDGRRYSEEMRQENSGSSRITYTPTEASQSILEKLWADFVGRNLTSADLRHGYVGPRLAELKALSLAEQISEVDFDLAIEDLSRSRLVDSGPKEMPKPDPFLTMCFPISKKEYYCITQEGYKVAKKRDPNLHGSNATQQITISNSTFHSSNIAAGNSVIQKVGLTGPSMRQILEDLRNEARLVDDGNVREQILSKVDAIQTAPDKQTMRQGYNDLVATIGNLIKAFSPLLEPLLDSIAKHS